MTTPRDDLEVRAATAEDYDGVRAVLERAFGEDFGDETDAGGRSVFEPERNLVVVDGDRIVANAGAYTRELTVPGAVLPAAHVTLVGVHPTYRRRGLLTRLMGRQLREVRDAGVEPVAVLWASESPIYQRFGYGLAVGRYRFEGDRRDLRMLPRVGPRTGRLRELDPADARKDLIDVYERVRPARVGLSGRSEQWWDRILADPKEHRGGATARRALLYEGPDGVTGYALWRTKSDWGPQGPDGRVEVREVVAASPQAYAELWRFLLDVDLTREVHVWCAALDEPVLYLVDEPRAFGARHQDGLWLRITDLPAALTARRYAGPLDVVLAVDDALLPGNAGRWRLRATAAGTDVTCLPAGPDEAADLACDIADLGAAYLGGVSLAALAGGGRVRELRPGALEATSVAFGWSRQPSVLEVF